jgi:hypothetical protein
LMYSKGVLSPAAGHEALNYFYVHEEHNMFRRNGAAAAVGS